MKLKTPRRHSREGGNPVSLGFYAAGFPLSLWESSLTSDDRFAGEQHAAQIPRFTLRGNDEIEVAARIAALPCWEIFTSFCSD